MRFKVSLAALATCLLAASGWAMDNLVVNGDFDVDLAGWAAGQGIVV